MPVASNTRLAPHFTAAELGADHPNAGPVIVANLTKVAAWLEAARAIVAAPLRVTSGYRTAERNAAVGGSATSDHVNGLAADIVAVGKTPFEVYGALTAAERDGRLPAFDQVIFYTGDDHLHVGLGSRMRRQVLRATKEAGGPTIYADLTPELVSGLRGYV